METITFKNTKYPAFQATGNAARFIKPFADEFLKDKTVGLDIGCMTLEWCYPGATPIDLTIDDPYDAYNLPNIDNLEYIFSSHCLEHLPDWVGALNLWRDSLPSKGTLFLYLPHYSQKYWQPWHNRKHYHALTNQLLTDYFQNSNEYWSDWFVSPGADLNNSFCCVAEKA